MAAPFSLYGAKLMQPHELALHFLTWQCRLRQIAMREAGGRPSGGMCPAVFDAEGNELAGAITTLITRENPSESTEFLRFQVQKHHDPEDIYKKSLTYLQSTHYQRAIEFSDELTAIFGAASSFVERLMEEGKCVLRFEEYSQNYTLPCRVRILEPSEPAFSASEWHSRVFNPKMGDGFQVIGFQPDWDEAVQMKENYRPG